jgi:hypothetical protein
MNFSYIIEKIKDAKIIEHPFPHLDIQNLLSEEHLNLIINDTQIHFEEMKTNDELHEKLIKNGWKIQNFPGCVDDWKSYIDYLEKKKVYIPNNPVESVGITFRLSFYKNNIIKELIKYMKSDLFHNALKNKFNIKAKTSIITAIQKNLTGYEISPHPDIRKKCLTYLLNINNNIDIEKEDCHTHLLEFKEEYKYKQKFWKENPNIEREWVPWNWCNTVKTMSNNNSMVIFHPDNDPPTLHAIRLKYDHLKYQRTQIYGNLMYEK